MALPQLLSSMLAFSTHMTRGGSISRRVLPLASIRGARLQSGALIGPLIKRARLWPAMLRQRRSGGGARRVSGVQCLYQYI